MKLEAELSDDTMDKLAVKVAANIVGLLNNQPQSKKEKLYTVSDICENTGQSESTVTRHIRLGLMKASKVGKSWLVTEENYKNYINIQPE